MSITYDQNTGQIHLFNDQISYIMQVQTSGLLLHSYFGKRIVLLSGPLPYPVRDSGDFSPRPVGYENTRFTLDSALQEIPGGGNGDYRTPCFEVTYADGTKATDLRFVGATIRAGKPKLNKLPATYVKKPEEADTIEVSMCDNFRHLEITLQYTIFKDLPVITRSIIYKNNSNRVMTLGKAYSFAVDLPDDNFELLQLPGAWAREKQIVRTPLVPGDHVLESRRGASSVFQQPFLALVRPSTTEDTGELYASHFVYSGSFRLEVAVDHYHQARLTGGINPVDFSWELKPDTEFQTPEMVTVYTDQGLHGMSKAFYRLYGDHLVRGEYQYRDRPVVFNSWETLTFNFNEQRLVSLAAQAKAVGAEVFVVDDGWFGHRDSDSSSLGDWSADRQKLPSGIKSLATKIHALNMGFGLWFEPEMVSPDSELYRAHPDWAIAIPGVSPVQGRHQLVLDFSRADVRTHIMNAMSQIIDAGQLDFIKWDMNRNIASIYSASLPPERQMETLHRYILGLYAFLEELTSKYPNVLFENCSGGGGRFDAGMAYYMPQSWASDDTDAWERTKIQYGTSLLFPPVMIDAHLSESPNQQVGRITDFRTRVAVAGSANLGLMLELDKKTPEELSKIKAVVEAYKKKRHMIQFGNFYRLISPFTSDYGAWEFVDETRRHVLVYLVQALNQPSKPLLTIKLTGLIPGAHYRVANRVWYGAELMQYGLYLNEELDHDFASIDLAIDCVD